jgi:hypothetical protein
MRLGLFRSLQAGEKYSDKHRADNGLNA